VLQVADSLPTVDAFPAPWDLIGQGWVIALRLPPEAAARQAFVPAAMQGHIAGPVSLLVFADYARANCGPYHELLFIPGLGRFGKARRCPTVSRILVSTWASVVNGRANWGIPKDRADFDVRYGATRGNDDRVLVSNASRKIAELRLATIPMTPSVPVYAGLVPKALRTLAQYHEGRVYRFAPQASGWCRPGRLLSWSFDAELFPDLVGARVLAAFKVSSFRMTFPVAEILEAASP
jgi:hypothetical protein